MKAFLGWSLFIVALSVLGVGTWRKAHPVYSSEAILLVELPKTASSPGAMSVLSCLAILVSDDFSRYVNSSFTAEELALIRRGLKPLQPLPSVARRAVLPEDLTIRADKPSGKIFVKFRSAVPEAAALVANHWALGLIDYTLDRAEMLKKPQRDPGVAIIGRGMQNTNIGIFDTAPIPTRADNAWW